MPHIPLIASDGAHNDAIRVLITGFGPFASYSENPSWLAVKKLHNIILETQSATVPVTFGSQEVLAGGENPAEGPRSIHVTALEVPVKYSAVLSTVPGLHARPPILPPLSDARGSRGPPPPPDGYDFVLHVGAGRKGNLRAEKLGHKLGYSMPDVGGEFAPVVPGGSAPSHGDKAGARTEAAEAFERARIGFEGKGNVVRGFGEGYEQFDEDLRTAVDVDELVERLKEIGVEQIEPSTDAGHYLCDFIYYCSLAEAERTREKVSGGSPKSKSTKVLFIHCPPVGEPLTTEYVANALKRVVVSVCGNSV
ncbi:hypothetical protein M0805_008694 [Coniferiporia weirii]|nr:hypothetical protein M0805_008694 [Coniferiporia weirii]